MSNGIYCLVQFRGASSSLLENSLIDTGAYISVLPRQLAVDVGAWATGLTVPLMGIHGNVRELEIASLFVNFPSLNDAGGKFNVAVDSTRSQPLIGIDVLRLLGITINTESSSLSINNRVWEAFRTISGFGVLMLGTAWALDKLLGSGEQSGAA